MARLPSPLLLILVAMLIAPPVGAAGVNLSWDACTGEDGVQNKAFACNTNSGSWTIFGSFVLAEDQPNFVAAEIRVDLRAETDSLPAWWQFRNAGACRNNALTLSFNFTDDPGTSCTDPWSGQATGAIAGYQTYWTTPQVPSGNPNEARILAIAAVPSTMPMPLTAGTEYYCFKLTMSAAKTVGSGACMGCSVPACIVLTQLDAIQSDNNNQQLTQPVSSNVVTWQSVTSCPAGNAPQNVTWGQIRSILR